MTQLVQIAPGIVFSSDVLGVAWLRKHHWDTQQSSNAPSNGQRVDSTTESDLAIPEALSIQMSLL